MSEWVGVPEWAMSGVVIVDPSLVNMDDLLHANRPGAIVRVKDINAIKFVPPMLMDLDLIAGYVSEDV